MYWFGTWPQGDNEGMKDADPVVEAYKAGIDRTLIRENLKLSVEKTDFARRWHCRSSQTSSVVPAGNSARARNDEFRGAAGGTWA